MRIRNFGSKFLQPTTFGSGLRAGNSAGFLYQICMWATANVSGLHLVWDDLIQYNYSKSLHLGCGRFSFNELSI